MYENYLQEDTMLKPLRFASKTDQPKSDGSMKFNTEIGEE